MKGIHYSDYILWDHYSERTVHRGVCHEWWELYNVFVLNSSEVGGFRLL